MTTSKTSEIKVYYNSACPVCDIGINWQKGKSNMCNLEWKDIHSDNDLVTEIGKDIESARKYLHILEGNSLHTGVNAFIKIWQNSPTENWKAKFLSLPIVKQLAIGTYFVFANFLYLFNRLMKNW